jgi:hypothetical protein
VLVKVLNFKISNEALSRVVRWRKVKTFHSYGAVLTGSCADESEDFQQLKGVFHRIMHW